VQRRRTLHGKHLYNLKPLPAFEVADIISEKPFTHAGETLPTGPALAAKTH